MNDSDQDVAWRNMRIKELENELYKFRIHDTTKVCPPPETDVLVWDESCYWRFAQYRESPSLQKGLGLPNAEHCAVWLRDSFEGRTYYRWFIDLSDVKPPKEPQR